MYTLNEAHHRIGWIAVPRIAVVALLVLILIAGEVRAQQQIAQDGRLFDANTQVGGSRFNYIRPVSPLVGGNPYATGNIGRGLSLRSFSPISSPTAFHAELGSSSLSNFMRDSISTGYAYSPGGGLSPTAFFDPARTAPTGGYLRGFYDYQPVIPARNTGGEGIGAAYAAPGVGGFQQYGASPVRRQVYDTSRQLSSQKLGQPLDTQLSSSIFGVVEPPRLPGPLSGQQLQPNLEYMPEIKPYVLGFDEAEATADGTRDPLDLRVWPEPRFDETTPLDILMRENARRLLTERTVPTFQQPSELPGEPGIGLLAEGEATPGTPSLPGMSVQPGGDVFTDMQLALELSRNPQAEWYADMQGAAGVTVTGESPTLSMERQARAVGVAEEFLTRMFEAPLQTFAGESTTAINDELRKAEAAMELGHYYDAVRHYERARVLDPANPLSMIGKGHALLAAGEYVSAAVSLINGLERFPNLARFQVNLEVLIGGGEIVDIRRADLMRQLSRREDPQLRFLLGYLEIHSGIAELGLRNLEKAAERAGPGSLIYRYPDMIRHKVIFSPTLSPGAIDGSTPAETGTPATEPSTPGKESE